MNVFFQIDSNLMAAIMLGAILIIAYNRLDKRDMLNQTYLLVCLAVLAELVLEAGSFIIDGRPEKGFMILSYLVNIFLLLTAPVLSYFGYILTRNIVCPNRPMKKNSDILLKIPIVINILAILLSIKYHYVFYIDSLNQYHRGPFFLGYMIITYFYILLCINLTISRRKQSSPQNLIPLLIAALLISIGFTIQSFIYGAMVMWGSVAISLVIIYVFLQERMVHLDDLTGAWTRGSFNYYIDNILKQRSRKKIGIIFCDIDDLKLINDEYGHLEGDHAIKDAIKIIKNELTENDIIVRMGGDEFIIILQTEQYKNLERILIKIKTAFQNYNNLSDNKYKLDCSFGGDILNLGNWDIEDFIHHIDSIMYQNKRMKKFVASN